MKRPASMAMRGVLFSKGRWDCGLAAMAVVAMLCRARRRSGAMLFNAGRGGADVGVGVGMDVGAAILVGASPGAVVDEDRVRAPAEACAEPSEAAEGDAEGDGGAEADGSADEEAAARRAEDDEGIVDGDVVEVGVEGLDFDVAALVDDVDVGVGLEVAVAQGLAAEALDGVHDVGALGEDGVAELAGPVGVAGHHVEHGGEGQEGEDAGVPGEVVGLDRGGESVGLRFQCLRLWSVF